MSIKNSYVADLPRLVIKLEFPNNVKTLKEFIEDALSAALTLFVNQEVADDAARLALTGLTEEYLVYQTDTKEFWRLTGVDPSEAGDWTLVAQSVADAAARLAITDPPLGTIVFQEDNSTWWNYIGDPSDHTNDDPTDAEQWLNTQNEVSYTPYLYAFLKSLSWKLTDYSWIRNATDGEPVKLLTAFVKSGDGSSPYDSVIMDNYGVTVAFADGWVQVGNLEAQLTCMYSANTPELELNIGFIR